MKKSEGQNSDNSEMNGNEKMLEEIVRRIETESEQVPVP